MKRPRVWLYSISPGFSKQLFFSYIFIFVTALLLFSGAVYVGTSAMLKNRLIETGSETVRQAALNIGQYMDDVESLTFNISVNATVQNALSNESHKTDFAAVLESENIVNQMISVDVFANKTGGVILFAEHQNNYPVYQSDYLRPETGSSSKSAVFRANEVQHEPWYLHAIAARGKVVWEKPETGIVNQEAEFSASRMILNNKNPRQSMGVVRVFVPVSRFETTLRGISFGSEGTAYLFTGNAIFGDGSEKTHEQIAQAVSKKDGTVSYHTIEGVPCCVIRCDISQGGWEVIGVIPEQTMLMQFSFVRNILLVALLAVFLLALVLIHFNSQNLSRPIHQIADAMRNFDADRSFRFAEDRQDEIGMLYQSYNRMMNRIDMLLKEVQKTANRQRKAELQALQAQINPHFLYNTLDCIKNIACLSDNQDIVKLTTSLSEFFRISLNKGAEMLPLRYELAHVRSYCDIQSFRSRTDFELRIDVPETLMERPVIKLILQPLVENAIIHGFAGKRGRGIIEIHAREQKDFLILSVCDNGTAADVEYLNGLLSGEYTVAKGKAAGYGIQNVDERIKLTFGSRSGLHYLENPGGGLIAEIRIAQRACGEEDEANGGKDECASG